MNKYELLLVLPGTLDDKEVEARSQEILALAGEYGTEATMHSMGKNRLAYPVKQIRYGYYFTITFISDTEKVKMLESKLGLTRDLLRAMISHFNVDLSAQQRMAYAAQNQLTQERETPVALAEKVQEQVNQLVEEKEKAEQAPESKVARKVENIDMDKISKKLDDLMSGDVIPGV